MGNLPEVLNHESEFKTQNLGDITIYNHPGNWETIRKKPQKRSYIAKNEDFIGGFIQGNTTYILLADGRFGSEDSQISQKLVTQGIEYLQQYTLNKLSLQEIPANLFLTFQNLLFDLVGSKYAAETASTIQLTAINKSSDKRRIFTINYGDNPLIVANKNYAEILNNDDLKTTSRNEPILSVNSAKQILVEITDQFGIYTANEQQLNRVNKILENKLSTQLQKENFISQEIKRILPANQKQHLLNKYLNSVSFYTGEIQNDEAVLIGTDGLLMTIQQNNYLAKGNMQVQKFLTKLKKPDPNARLTNLKIASKKFIQKYFSNNINESGLENVLSECADNVAFAYIPPISQYQ